MKEEPNEELETINEPIIPIEEEKKSLFTNKYFVLFILIASIILTIKEIINSGFKLDFMIIPKIMYIITILFISKYILEKK